MLSQKGVTNAAELRSRGDLSNWAPIEITEGSLKRWVRMPRCRDIDTVGGISKKKSSIKLSIFEMTLEPINITLGNRSIEILLTYYFIDDLLNYQRLRKIWMNREATNTSTRDRDSAEGTGKVGTSNRLVAW